MDDTFTVLLVCTANQCRSPMAELILRDRLADSSLGWLVSSAGTHAADRSRVVPEAVLTLDRYGVESRGFRSRRLDRSLIDAADLVLTAERGHAERVIGLVPTARDRTFPLLQFARLVADGDRNGGPRAGAAMIAHALEVRGRSQPGPESEELADPVGGPRRGYRHCAELIRRAVDTILGLD